MRSDPVPPLTSRRTRSTPAWVAAAVVVSSLVVGSGTVLLARSLHGVDDAPPSSPSSPSTRPAATMPSAIQVAEQSVAAPRDEVRAGEVLRSWDRRRAAAWATGRAHALDPLYTPGSSTGRRDHQMLAAWQRRGMAVEDLHTQVLRVRVLGHRPGRFDLVVVDRVRAATAVGDGVRRPLPRDSPSTRRVVLVRGASGWQVESARPR